MKPKKKSKTNKKNSKKSKKKTIGKVRETFSRETLKQAVEAHLQEGLSLRKIEEKYSISRSTVARAAKNIDNVCRKPGPPTILTVQEEEAIAEWILQRAVTGQPVVKVELLDHVQKYLTLENKETPFKDNRPGRHWYESFMKRHPNLTIRTAQQLPSVRVNVTSTDLLQWFAEIKQYLSSKNILEIPPHRIFNLDETYLLFNPKYRKVLAPRGSNSVYNVIKGSDKENLTVLFTYSADGTRAPPMILYPYKQSVPKNIIQNVPREWGIGISDDGWMTKDSFYEYMLNVFFKWLKKTGVEFPVIVYMDGHSSHFTLPLVEFCRKNQIELIGLFPHSSHLTQPLDVGFFHPFKEHWITTVMRWKANNKIDSLTRENFPIVLNEAVTTFTEERTCVINGFKAAGLVPFDPIAVDFNVLDKKKKKCSSTSNVQTEIPASNDSSSSEASEKVKFIETIEKNQSWNGAIEYFGLFEYWLSIKYTHGIYNP